LIDLLIVFCLIGSVVIFFLFQKEEGDCLVLGAASTVWGRVKRSRIFYKKIILQNLLSTLVHPFPFPPPFPSNHLSADFKVQFLSNWFYYQALYNGKVVTPPRILKISSVYDKLFLINNRF